MTETTQELADKGYPTGGEAAQLEQGGMEVLVATTVEGGDDTTSARRSRHGRGR